NAAAAGHDCREAVLAHCREQDLGAGIREGLGRIHFFRRHVTRVLGLTGRMLGRATVAGVIAAVMIGLAGAPAVAAPADPGERAEALLPGTAIDRYVAKQLPATFAVRG